jgi:hypothetical protein
LGILLREFFSHLAPLLQGESDVGDEPRPLRNDCDVSSDGEEPARKKAGSRTLGTHVPLLVDLGCPSSLCLLVQNLLQCGGVVCPDYNAYHSLDAVIKDLHLLLLDPCRFLFDIEPSLESGIVQLSFREHKLYGRENEVSAITDAFCRVSTGKREALFIGGFSGSGKTRLVNGLTARVDVAGGYVLTHTFDQMSKDRPLLAVTAVFNQLCLRTIVCL